MPFTVAIDGPAAAGKGTIARAVALQFGFGHLDTGLLYRAVGAKTMQGVPALEAAQALTEDDIRATDLRTREVAQSASKVAVLPDVRSALVDFQRSFARRAGGAVLDGRDIGTVICPNADAKLFVTASDDVRARRRLAELSEKDPDLTFEQVLGDLRARDARDSARAAAPMIQASDAKLIDTSALTIDQAVALACTHVESLGARG